MLQLFGVMIWGSEERGEIGEHFWIYKVEAHGRAETQTEQTKVESRETLIAGQRDNGEALGGKIGEGKNEKASGRLEDIGCDQVR